MTTVGRLLTRKQNLIARLRKNPAGRERGEVEQLLAKVDTALERKRLAAEEGAIALQEAAQRADAVRENMARLRDLRLAKEQEDSV